MPDISKLIQKIKTLTATNDRIMVAIAGPPAAGKSRIVEKLLEVLDDAVVVPMDGYHLDNVILEKQNLLSRKGSPQTFDVLGYLALLKRIKTEQAIVYAPIFDRDADMSRACAIAINPETKIILAEGNYLLLNEAPWNQLEALFDLTVFLDVPEDVLYQRLLQRWLDQGLSLTSAQQRAQSNDLVNAKLVIQRSKKAAVNIV